MRTYRCAEVENVKLTIATIYRGTTGVHQVFVFKGAKDEVEPKVMDSLHTLLCNLDHPDEAERDQLFFAEANLLDPDDDVLLTYAQLY